MMKSSLNRNLLIGGAGLAVLLFLVIFGPHFAPYRMNHVIPSYSFHKPDGHFSMYFNPIPSVPEYPLGTDLQGRDMLSILLDGARIIISFAAIVAFARVFLGFFLACFGIQFPRVIGALNEKIGLAFITFPGVILVILFFPILNVFPRWTMLLANGVLILLVGLFPTAYTLQGKMQSIMASPYMEGLRALGAGRLHILRKHLIPHLLSFYLSLFISEIAQILSMVTQLGVVMVFLGGITFIPQSEPVINFPEDWAAQVGFSFRALISSPSVVLYPASALTLSILTFNMLSAGIRQYHERKWGSESKA